MNARPSAVKLNRTYDAERLLADVRACERVRKHWLDHKMVAIGTSKGRRMLQLRTRGGHLLEVDTNDNQIEPYKDTELMAHAPYVRSILDELEIRASSVLFLALEPGGRIKEHADGDGWRLGSGHEIRLHIPIVTNDKVFYVIGGQRHDPQPGEIWYGNFSLPHWFANEGAEARLYLMINTRVNEKLLSLFPSDFLEGLDVQPDPPPFPTPPELRAMPGFSFKLPGITPEMEPFISALPARYQALVRAALSERHTVQWYDDELWVMIGNHPLFAIVLEGPRRMRVIEQPVTLEFDDVVDGAPQGGSVEIYVRGETFRLPVELGPLSASPQ
jgi:hypothetical protein